MRPHAGPSRCVRHCHVCHEASAETMEGNQAMAGARVPRAGASISGCHPGAHGASCCSDPHRMYWIFRLHAESAEGHGTFDTRPVPHGEVALEPRGEAVGRKRSMTTSVAACLI